MKSNKGFMKLKDIDGVQSVKELFVLSNSWLVKLSISKVKAQIFMNQIIAMS